MTQLNRNTLWALGLVLAGLTALVLATGCTPEQVEAWKAWHHDDAAAAVAFLDTPKGQQLLREPAPVTAPYRAAWDRVAWCESGQQWHHPPVRNRHGSFSGGLMIWDRAWDQYGGGRYAADAWLATKAEQIVIAEAILDDVGWKAWQCA